MRYHHIGIPTTEAKEGEAFLEGYGVWVTSCDANPYGIEWLRFEPDCSLPEVVKTLPHIAFEVDDLEQALLGKEVIIEPNSPSEGVRVAFIVHEGAPVEFLEIA